MQKKFLKKLALGGRATFVSPYLRRPLRPLDKVLSERAGPDEGKRAALHRDDAAGDTASATLGLVRKHANTSD